MKRKDWDAEACAADQLQRLLGGGVVLRDGHDAVHRDSTHDFDLVFDMEVA